MYPSSAEYTNTSSGPIFRKEGRLMKVYATGTADERADALENLGRICGRVKKLREKYFAF